MERRELRNALSNTIVRVAPRSVCSWKKIPIYHSRRDRRPNCLNNHRWEHTRQWRSKHQKVQLLEVWLYVTKPFSLTLLHKQQPSYRSRVNRQLRPLKTVRNGLLFPQVVHYSSLPNVEPGPRIMAGAP
ncbi:hypothetical protein BYT27DRAFT_6458843 [Phlegmacium glaucopus]|nr:hypothetical protein BYT27DRAFT_6458843 [Phlegmacium glaucopus]